MPLLGEREEDDEKEPQSSLVEETVRQPESGAKRVYLVPEDDIKFGSDFVDWIKERLMGKKVVMGKRLEFKVGDHVLHFKVWRVEPFSSGVISPKTKLFITKTTFKSPSVVVSVDKVLGILALLEGTLKKPLGYAIMTAIVEEMGRDLTRVEPSKVSKLLDDLETIEEYCLKVADENNGNVLGWLAVKVLEEVYNLRKLFRGQISQGWT